MNIIEIKNISKYYGDNVVLNDISFNIQRGEICGLLGLNGAGKSTLMKIIICMINADSGEIRFEGRRFNRDDLLNIGALIENPPIYGNLSAYDNLKVKALLYGIEDEDIRKIMDMVGLGRTNKRAALFSMGMKMRLGIGLALLTKPKFLLLDEPTNGLGPEGIKKLKEMLLDLSESGTGILLSSHQLHDIAGISDKIVIINKGRMEFNGSINDTEDLERTFFKVIHKGGHYNVG